MSTKKSISRIFSILFVLAFMLVSAPLQAAHAAGVRYVKPGGAGDCSGWVNACDLQTALTGAVSGDQIWVAAGMYKPTTDPTDRTATFQLKSGVALYGGFAGTETSLDQRNPATNATILSGDLNGDDNGNVKVDEPTRADNSYHVVTGANDSILDGFTITAGNANGNYPDDIGGGMSNNSGSPTLTDVTFSGNSAGYIGGGMYNQSSSPTLTDVTFSANSATEYGGGMYNLSSNPTLTNVAFNNNSTIGNGDGGGIYNSSSSPTLTNVTFSGNSADYLGGGMYNYNNSSPTLTNVTFSDNSAEYGGGMYNDTSSPTLTNVTFSGNYAWFGGGIYNTSGSSPMIRNTILWGNTASPGAQIYNDGSTPSVSDSVVQGGCPAGSNCTNIITADPLLGPLSNYGYGGFTETFSLLPGSSAIDAGNDAVCPATDQRGVARPQGAHCDIGAYEYNYIVFHVHYVKPVASGTGTCSNWANACILQSALGTSISGDEIWVAAGTYKPTTDPIDRTTTFQLKDGVALYGGFAGMETARSQRNPAANVTILSGDLYGNDNSNVKYDEPTRADNSYHVVTGVDGATMDGFTITAGNANIYSVPNDRGGGMYNYSSSPTLTNVTFTNNSAWYAGGGMSNDTSSPTLMNVTFSGNSAYFLGGGIFNSTNSPTLTNVTFTNNSANSYGGGMYILSGSPTLTNLAFTNNHSTNGDGGGIYINGSPTLTNVTFSGNSANSLAGGGMYNTGSPTLTNVTFSGNSAEWGGGIFNDLNGNPTLTNVTFSGNSATREGGGIDNKSIFSPQIRNTIFWGNTAATGGAQIYNYLGSAPGLSYTIVQGGCPAGSTCTHIITTDPLLGTLGNYGGYTQTIPLLAGSSAIDTGNDAVCPGTDQRGVTRPQGAHCDIGAFEVVSTPPPTHVYLPLVVR